MLFRKLAFSVGYVLAKILGVLFWIFFYKRRNNTIHSVEKHLSVSQQEATIIAYKSFIENFQSFLECFLIPFFGFKSPELHIAQPERFKAMLEVTRPIVATTGHFGSWELLAALLGGLSKKKLAAVVVRKYKNRLMQNITTWLRSNQGALVFGHRNTTVSILRVLNKKGVVAFLVDHNTSQNEALFLPFLGEIAAVNKGPAILAVRAKALVFPVFLERVGYTYIFHIEKPLDTCMLTGTIEEKVYAVAKYYTEAVEKIIQHSPSQWFWMHNRWKTRPNIEP